MTDTAEMKTLERLRLATPKMSVSEAAKRAGMSEGRWRQLAKGYQQVDKDTRVPATAPAETLARMARAVGATPDQLAEAGREDAAELLRASPAWEPTDPDRIYHTMRMAVYAAVSQLTAVMNLAIEQENTAVITAAAESIASMTGLLPGLAEWRVEAFSDPGPPPASFDPDTEVHRGVKASDEGQAQSAGA